MPQNSAYKKAMFVRLSVGLHEPLDKPGKNYRRKQDGQTLLTKQYFETPLFL
jgi:hypothetical protein